MSNQVCKVCGHEACPGCGAWCDTLIYYEEDGEKDVELCCAGVCVYEMTQDNLVEMLARAAWNYWVAKDWEIAEYWLEVIYAENPT